MGLVPEAEVDYYRNMYSTLLTKYRAKKEEVRALNNKLDTAEFRIRQELTPRIEAEKKSYDRWANNGGGDECMQNGVNGNCGPVCSIFGQRDECLDECSNSQLAEYYRDGDVDEDEMWKRGLSEEKLKIDWIDDWSAFSQRTKYSWYDFKIIWTNLYKNLNKIMEKK